MLLSLSYRHGAPRAVGNPADGDLLPPFFPLLFSPRFVMSTTGTLCQRRWARLWGSPHVRLGPPPRTRRSSTLRRRGRRRRVRRRRPPCNSAAPDAAGVAPDSVRVLHCNHGAAVVTASEAQATRRHPSDTVVGASPPPTSVACVGGSTGSECVLVAARGVASVSEALVVGTPSAALLVARVPATRARPRV